LVFFNYNGNKVFYEIKRAESTNFLIFIHGSGSNSNIWRYQFDIDNNYNLIAIDLPSHGRSDKFETLSLELYVDVLQKLVESLNYEKMILCGHSLGGAVIQSYYFTYPNLVNKLILVGTGARLRVSPVILESLKTNYDKFLKDLPIGAFSRKTPPNIINEYIKETSKIGPEVTYQDFSICNRFDTMNLTSTIRIPIIIITGKEDKLTPVKYANYFKEKVANSKSYVIEKAGHMVMIEQSERFNEIIKENINS
jgi:pimeloyl-ACP methyl ester carboxylesterase